MPSSADEPIIHAAEPFVRRALAAMEADLRALALVALAEWEKTALVAPELFQPVAALQRPSWGTWNGLLIALKSARRKRSSSSATRSSCSIVPRRRSSRRR
jgi:hypothetical protein